MMKSPSYTILIPFYAGDEYRIRNIKFLIRYYLEFTNAVIVVAEQKSKSDFSEFDGPRFHHVYQSNSSVFNKTRAWNYGMQYIKNHLHGDIVLMLDSDIIIENRFLHNEFIENEMKTAKVLHPFTSIIDLQRFETYEFINEFGISKWNPEADRYRSGYRCYGGALFIRICDYLEIGGFDTRFDAWGNEDDVFYYTAIRKWKFEKCRRLTGVVYHLHHPISNTSSYVKSEKYKQFIILRLKIVRSIKSENGLRSYILQNQLRNGIFVKRNAK